MSPGPSQINVQSLPTVGHDDLSIVVELEPPCVKHDLSGYSIDAAQDGLTNANASLTNLMDAPEFPDFSFSYQDVPEGPEMVGLGDHGTDVFAASGGGSISSMGDRKDSIASGPLNANFAVRRHSAGVSEDGSQGSNHAGGNFLENNMEDEFGLIHNAPGDGTDHGAKFKDNKSDATPAWSELKTKAGKERKRLPLACIACRRKKIRCSGEKPACKHCLRSRLPCVYKVTTRKAAPRTDYMAMLDKRLKRMEDRIIKIVPKSERDASAANVTRAVVKPAIPGSLTASKQTAKKRAAEEAFGPDLDNWARAPSKTKIDDSNKPTSLQIQEREDGKLLTEGRDALPPTDIREHLAEVFFESIYGQAYHLLHKPSYMRKLKADTLPPVLILSVCAISARFSNHPTFANTQHNFLRGEEWAAHARDIVTKRYEWPNITILTCLLILGLHEFGTCHGGRSWSLGGQAIRMAFALQLHKDLEYDPTRLSSSNKLSFIDREIRRRVMWACFLMDRFNSSGTDRPMFVKEETVKIQLPIKEKLFQLDMPGPTEDLDGRVPHPVPDDEGQLSSAKDNMGVAAYIVRSIAIWGRIIGFLNQGGKEDDSLSIWEPESKYSALLKQAEDFAECLPDGLKYTSENLHLHDTEGMANQFLFLHISMQQNMLFMNRFAASSCTGVSMNDVPKTFITEAGQKAFEAANKISELLKDAEAYFIAAPFVGYCAFLSGTVHIFGIFSGNVEVQSSAKKNLATNVKFLAKMKKYWGMFHFMSENLREEYRRCADAARQGTPANEANTASPVFQYGDWFDRYPHGVSQADFLDPAESAKKKMDTGEDAVLEQKPEAYTIEEFFTQLSPPQSTEGRTEGSNSSKNNSNNRTPMAKRKSVTKKGGMSERAEHQQLEPLMTDLNAASLPEHIQHRLRQQRNYQASRLGGQTSGPAPFHSQLSRTAHSQNVGSYHALSPISPVTAVHGQHPGQFAHTHTHAGHPGFYNPDLLAMGLSNNSAGLLPQLDRQLVFGAYGGMDPTTSISGPEGLVDWDALAGNSGDNAGASSGGHGHSHHDHGFGSEPSSAWFMPFNMEPPELGQDVSGIDFANSGMFSPSNMAPRPGVLRRSSHMQNR